MATGTLQWPDHLIMASFLVISIGIGVYHSVTGGKQKTLAEFIMADRRLQVIPTAISLLVSYTTTIGLLGLSAEAYCFGIQYLIFAGIFSGTVSMLIVGRILIPLFYPLKFVSINEYLERRFLSRHIRIFVASFGIPSVILFMGTSMFITSSTLESATGLSLKISVPLLAVVAVSYTVLGGMRAVIWTDVFQFFIMAGGLMAIFIKGISSVGGIANVFHVAQREGRLEWYNLSPDPRVRHTVWGLTIAMTLTWIQMYGFSQASIQRFSAVKNLSKAKLTVLVNLPPMLMTGAICAALGFVVLAYYATVKCDPLANGDVLNMNQLLPYFVFNIFADAPGFGGLFLATLYGAALSTLSTVLSGSAANIWEDILQWKLAKLTESRKTLINRFIIIAIGVLSCAMAFLTAFIPGPVTQVVGVLGSLTGGPFLGVFLLGVISRHANWKGALIGCFTGMAFSLWLTLGSLTMNRSLPLLPPVSVEGCKAVNESFAFNYNSSIDFEITDSTIRSYWQENVTEKSPIHLQPEEFHGLENFYAISYIWFGPFSTLITFVVGFIASLIMRDKELEAKVEDRYLIRYRNIFRCTSNEDEDNGAKDKSTLKDDLKKDETSI